MHSIAAGEIFKLGEFTVTNTMLAGFLTLLVIVIFSLLVRFSISLRPSKIQSFLEVFYDYIYNLVEENLGRDKGGKVFPWIFTFFIFILVSNYMGLLPIFGEAITVKQEAHAENNMTIVAEDISVDSDVKSPEHTEETAVYKEAEGEGDHKEEEKEESHGVAFLRGATTDLNYTFALGLISFLLVIGMGIIYNGPPIIGFILHYFMPGEISKLQGGMKYGLLPIFGFVGILEIFLEPLKSVSLSFRLFGNIYAGETLLGVMSTLINHAPTLFVATPFYIFEFLVGIIQAFVFALLTIIFISLVSKGH